MSRTSLDGTARGRAALDGTARGRAKEDRRAAMLDAAARLFARSGFEGVSIEELGAAVGVSGPALYRHFSGKQAVLGALLVEASRSLLAGGEAVVAGTSDDRAVLRGLVRSHARFALAQPDVIQVQDRDLPALSEADRREVRSLQRRYVELWVEVLARLTPDVDVAVLRSRAHATFGLLNSTPHSARGLSRARARGLLEQMALAALGHPTD